MPSEPIDIDQYTTQLRTAIADSLEIQNTDSPRLAELWEKKFANDKAISPSITQEQADRANANLNFFSEAKNFLSDAGHPVAFKTFSDMETAEEGLGGLYNPKKPPSIHMPIALDSGGNCQIDVDGGLKIVSTLSHEITHAVDDFMYSQVLPDGHDVTTSLSYHKNKNSYASFSFDNMLEEHFDNPRDVKKDWEKDVAAIFGIDINQSEYSSYKDSFVAELAPRLIEDHFAGRETERIARINALSEPNKSLTHAAISSFSENLAALHVSPEFNAISAKNNGFLIGFTSIMATSASQILYTPLPEKFNLEETEALVNSINQQSAPKQPTPQQPATKKPSNDIDDLLAEFDALDDKHASIDVSDILESSEAIGAIKHTFQNSKQPAAENHNTGKRPANHGSVSRY